MKIASYPPALRPAIVTAFLLMIPLVAMRFTQEVNWTSFDFIVAGILLFGSGLTYELVSRQGSTFVYRAAVGLAVGTALFLIWANLAVGVIGDEGDPANAMYVGVLAIGMLGAVIARLQAQGMAWVLFAMAAAQILAAVIALIAFFPTVRDEPPGLVGFCMLNLFFAALFSGSALLFQAAARAERHPARHAAERAANLGGRVSPQP